MVYDDSEQDRHGDEYRVWYVGLGDDDGEPVGRQWKHWNQLDARVLACKMARDRRLTVEYL